MLTNRVPNSVARYDSPVEPEAELTRLVPVWNGILHEFRNHLTVLLAAATEVRVATPPAVVVAISEALAETEWNVQRLNALVGFVDAAIRDGAPMVADLDDVVERALRLAAPTLGGAAVSFRKERRTGVGNRGSALESLLAALIVELARSDSKVGDSKVGDSKVGDSKVSDSKVSDSKVSDSKVSGNAKIDASEADCAEVGDKRVVDSRSRLQIDIHAETSRGVVVLEIESNGRRPAVSSWRFVLASDLAARIGGTVTTRTDGPGYIVRLA
jgi:hypothetical protein